MRYEFDQIPLAGTRRGHLFFLTAPGATAGRPSKFLARWGREERNLGLPFSQAPTMIGVDIDFWALGRMRPQAPTDTVAAPFPGLCLRCRWHQPSILA
jgi:hypothetical protein